MIEPNVIRAISLDPSIQVGYYGTHEQVIQQIRNDIEGVAVAIRWMPCHTAREETIKRIVDND